MTTPMFREGALQNPEPAMPSPEDDGAARRRQYLNGVLVRLQVATKMEREGPEEERARRDEIENVTAEYIMGLLAEAARTDGALRVQLEGKGLLDVTGGPTVGTDLGEHLTREMARSMPTRIEGFAKGLVATEELEEGIVKQLRNLIRNYRRPADQRIDRRAA